MNKYFIIPLFLLGISFSSCNDEKFLDSFPRGSMTDNTFWKTEADVVGVLGDCYMNTFDPNLPFKEARSDNSIEMFEWMNVNRKIADGSITPFDQAVEGIWNGYYTSIRKCNFFLEKIENLSFIDQDNLERYKAEGRVLRAVNYMYAAFDFANIPLVLKTLTVDESQNVSQSTQQEIYDFVQKELEECALILPIEVSEAEQGRLTRGACYGILARLFLFQNDYSNLLVAIDKLEKMGLYSLYTNGDRPFEDLFGGENQRNALAVEAVLPIYRAQRTGKYAAGHSTNAACLPKGVAEEDPYVTLYPAGSMVDAFPMLDGRLIHEAGSTYDPTHPTKDRDPRLAASVICPGDKMGRLVGDEIVWDLTYDPEDPNSYFSLRYDYIYTSTTGLFWKKCLDWSAWGFRNVWACANDMTFIRWADVLLMKAEALAETTGDVSSVCDIIDQLRDRCGGGRVHRENYASKEDLIRLVRNERRVELVNEGCRYYDLIRWRVAEKNPVVDGEGLNGPLFGAYMRLDGIGKDDRTVTVDGVPRRYVEPRTFDKSKNYLLPIPQKEINLNPKLQQNPGW